MSSINASRTVREGAGKSLARPGRKQATATKLRIYSTYSPRSLIHFLARCSNFCKPSKKIKNVVRPTRSPRQQWPRLRTKNGDLPIVFFQSREQAVVRRGQIRRIGWMSKTLEAQVGQFLLGCKCPVSRGIFVQEQDHLGELPAAFFLQNVLQLHQQRWVIPRVDSLALWKILNEEDAVLIPKNRGEHFSSGFLHSEFFDAGLAAMPPLHWLLLCLRVIVIQPDFVHGHQSRQEIIWIAPKKIPNVAQTTGTVDVFGPRSDISGPTSRRASAFPNIHEWWTQPAHVRCTVAQLLI